MSSRETFDKIDTDGDGFITVDELRAHFAGAFAAAHVEFLVHLGDRDGDNRLSFEEFARFEVA